MNIAIGADHRGFAYKTAIMKKGFKDITWIDEGTFDDTRTDYPLFAQKVAQRLVNREAQRGILICGSGVGMAMAANRYQGIYAAVVWNTEIARVSRTDDNSNVLVIPSDFVSLDVALAMISVWLSTEFLEGRYQQRISMIDQ